MKFGQLLEESMRPDWIAHYFNYKVNLVVFFLFAP